MKVDVKDMGSIPGSARSLGREDFLEEGTVTHSSILSWGIPWTENLAAYSPLGHKESDMTEAT